MVSKAGVALKGVSTLLRILELLGSLLILGICSYWMGVLSHRNSSIPTWMKAVEGISGGAVIYTAFAVILTFFVGGKAFFPFLGLLLDILFCGAMIAIAVLTRHGTHSCPSRNAPSPIGAGNRTSCRLETVVFAVAIILAVHFLITAALEILLKRNHQKEANYPLYRRYAHANNCTQKRYGPGPSNGYTSGSGKKPPFWKRNKKPTHDTELGVGGAGALITEEKHRHDNNRTSHETGVTGTTAGSYGGPTNKYGNEPAAPNNTYQNGGSGTNAPTNSYQPFSQNAIPAQSHKEVIHDPQPYTEIHHGGYPHTATRTEVPTTFGHGNYNAA